MTEFEKGRAMQRELDADFLEAYGFYLIDKVVRKGVTRELIDRIKKENLPKP